MAVTLTIGREKSDPFDVKLVREIIQPKSVTAKMEGDFGYVRLAGFNEKATDETLAAIKDLQAKDPQMKGLILDLRNNPGGLLDQSVGVADLFLDGGEVALQRGRDPQDIERYDAKSPRRAERPAAGGADQRRHGLGGGNRFRRVAGPLIARRSSA